MSESSPVKPSSKTAEQKPAETVTPNLPSEPSPNHSPNALTPEEQMALYEKDLKEHDWGHQPC
jgi:hypothetical protein